MRKLILNILTMFFIMLSLLALFWFLPGNYPHDLAAIINKRDMLVTKTSPRLIFMGGSSILTLNSRELEKNLKLPVANMGLWGGLSLKGYLDELRPYLKSGDILVITQEYPAVLDPDYIEFIDTNEDSQTFLFLMSPLKHIKSLSSNGQYLIIIKRILQLTQYKVKGFIQHLVTLNISKLFFVGYAHYQEDYNGNGDRRRLFKTVRPLDQSGKKFDSHNMKNHLFLNDFYKYAKKNSIKMLFYFSHIPREEYELNNKNITRFCRELKGVLEFPIMNRPEDFAFPRDYFADTIYHLNKKGEYFRTEKLIEMLKKHL